MTACHVGTKVLTGRMTVQRFHATPEWQLWHSGPAVRSETLARVGLSSSVWKDLLILTEWDLE